MEVRVIDPKDDSQIHNAGKVVGTVIRVIHPHRPPAPSPYRFLLKRALDQNAEERRSSGVFRVHPNPSDKNTHSRSSAPDHQNAEVEGHRLFLLNNSERTLSSQNFPPPASAPISKQNAGGPEKFVPPGMESQSPCSRSSNSTEVIVGSHKSFSPFRRFFSYLWSLSAFTDPSMERVNGRWRRKA